jgi:hypothetical protein
MGKRREKQQSEKNTFHPDLNVPHEWPVSGASGNF